MTTAIPTVTLNNGVQMPQIGFGVFQIPDDESTTAVAAALKAGYRSIDTAAIYGNESGVGKALSESGISREELFIASKLWIDGMGYDETLTAFEETLERLGLEYLDLYLIHWPAPEKDLYVQTWKALEKLYSQKKDPRDRSLQFPAVTSAEADRCNECRAGSKSGRVAPSAAKPQVIAANERHGIITEAWSPLAQGALLSDVSIQAIAAAHNITAAQVILRWHLQEGRADHSQVGHPVADRAKSGPVRL